MTSLKQQTPETEAVKRTFHESGFPNVEVYRLHDRYVLRARIIDARFRGLSRTQREKLVLPVVHSLPDETQMDLTVLLLLAPEEQPDSIMNQEFEQPSDSLL